MAGNSFGRGRNFGGQDRMMFAVFGLILLLIIGAIGYVVYATISENNNVQQNGMENSENSGLEGEMVNVLVPINNIPRGTQLVPSMFDKIQKPAFQVDDRAVVDYESVDQMYARNDLVAGESFMKDFITSVRPSSSIGAEIPEGYRAVTIRVNATSSVEGWARAGSRVDVNWTSQGIRGNSTIKTIVFGAKVLSAERQIKPNEDSTAPVPSTITLLVTSEEALAISLAETSNGTLSLTLRGDEDTGKPTGQARLTTDEVLNNGSGRIKRAQRRTKGVFIVGGQKYELSATGKIVPAGDDE